MCCNLRICEYTIALLYTRPEFDQNVKFLLLCRAYEGKGRKWLEEVFTKAFQMAHPAWNIEDIRIRKLDKHHNRID